MKFNNENNLALAVDGVSKYFGNKKPDGFMALNDVDMEIGKNKITAIIGSNGAGKTTLFNIISGFLRPDTGQIIYQPNGNAYVLNQLPAHRIGRLGVGRLFQDSHLFPNLSIMDNMIIAGKVSSTEGLLNSILKRAAVKTENKEREEQALNLFKTVFGEEDDPFSNRKDHYANTLSFGQQRLLAILRLFIGQYELLLLDEPTAGVNVEVIKKMVEIIKGMPQKGYTVLLIEHNWEFVLEVADFCYFLDEGEVAAFGTPADVLGNRKVRERYLGR
ncbi:MAG: ATP-binding cassette domain-containing protein [Candidatus Aminicenantes bacterium]|nr:ATP-binding cassette domain-containing protein [Candidatus Aminicenantes bacterium]